MGATNANVIDLRAFGLRSIESPSLKASAPCVNRVLRFLAQLDPPAIHEKSPREDIPRASSPGLRRSAAPSACRQCAARSRRRQGAIRVSTFILYSSELETGSVPLHIERG